MEELFRNRSPNESTFINHFVNAVYGILLGYGFSSSMGQIKQGPPGGVGRIFASLAVLFTILVVCVYWWDWYKNIGRKVASNFREFALDIAILVSLESLFFVYESPVAYSFVFFVLSILSLAWVVNYHLNLCGMPGCPKWPEYMNTNAKAKKHVQDRVAGIGLFGFCLLLTIFLRYILDQGSMLQLWIGSGVWFERLKGNWLELFLIVAAFAVNRKLFFKDRPGLDEDVVQFKTAQKKV